LNPIVAYQLNFCSYGQESKQNPVPFAKHYPKHKGQRNETYLRSSLSAVRGHGQVSNERAEDGILGLLKDAVGVLGVGGPSQPRPVENPGRSPWGSLICLTA
jgi:hypothetical protein